MCKTNQAVYCGWCNSCVWPGICSTKNRSSYGFSEFLFSEFTIYARANAFLIYRIWTQVWSKSGNSDELGIELVRKWLTDDIIGRIFSSGHDQTVSTCPLILISGPNWPYFLGWTIKKQTLSPTAHTFALPIGFMSFILSKRLISFDSMLDRFAICTFLHFLI